MAHPQPPVPPEQRSTVIRGRSSPPAFEGDVSADPGRDDSQFNLKERGAPGNLNQNRTPERRTQDR